MFPKSVLIGLSKTDLRLSKRLSNENFFVVNQTFKKYFRKIFGRFEFYSYFCIVFSDNRNIINSNAMCCGSLGKKQELSLNTHQKPQHHHNTADNSYHATEETSAVSSFSAKVNVKYIAKGSRNELLAVAFVATVRAYEHRNGARYSYSVNALHELTGIHAKTIEKRIAVLVRTGLAIREENGKIRLLSVKSKHIGHNIQFNIEVGMKALKQAEKSVLQERFMNKLRQIDYYRNAISRYNDFSNNPKSKVTLAEYKKLNLWLRSHCKTDYRNGKFVNYGWSYKKIAEYLYVSIKTAVEIVKAVVESGRVIKKKNSMFKKLTNKQEIEYIKHTFSFHGYSYKVYSNIYTITPSSTRGSAGTIRL